WHAQAMEFKKDDPGTIPESSDRSVSCRGLLLNCLENGAQFIVVQQLRELFSDEIPVLKQAESFRRVGSA
ncbi:hypothetical protein, partial [Planococcus chinensis]